MQAVGYVKNGGRLEAVWVSREKDGMLTPAFQVTYFKKRRVMEHQRDLTIKKLSAEGAQPMDLK